MTDPNRTSQCIVIATKNKAKAQEMIDLLQGLPFEVRTSEEMGFTVEIPETGDSFAENAVIKAETVCNALQLWAVADDSGLSVYCLDGAPGVYSARYTGEHATDEANNSKLLEALANVPRDQRQARFVSAIALARPGEGTICFEGICQGEVLETPRGSNGFGYDPLFLPLGGEESFAEISAEEKHKISHRGNAMRALLSFLNKEMGV